jgi:hypothetical protein
MQKCKGGLKAVDDCTYGTVVKLDDVVKNHPMSNTEHVVQDIHDILFSYYKVARQRFADNVCMHPVDHFSSIALKRL